VAAWLAVPLRVRDVDRGLVLAGTTGRPYTDAEAQVVAALAGQGAAALDNATLFHTIRDLATRDGLTGLYNRRHFFELAGEIVTARRDAQRPTAAIMVDIDHFKAINDTHGHPAGDDVIREVGHRLSRAVRDTDLICRYGGEEFAVLLAEDTAEGALAAAERLLARVTERPIDTRAGALPVTVSVGLAEPASSSGAGALLSSADQALYVAKRGGRNRVAVAEPAAEPAAPAG
jgi:diguanylate cyclase (GGDEF)-like protein